MCTQLCTKCIYNYNYKKISCKKNKYRISQIVLDAPTHSFGTLRRNEPLSKPGLRSEHPVFRGDGLSGSIEASVAMHGFFLYAVFFNGSLAALGPVEDSLSLPFYFSLSFLCSLCNLLLSPPSSSPGEPPRFFPLFAVAVSFPPHVHLDRSRALLFLRPPSLASLSSALLFPALVGKPSGPFARRSPLARAAGRHIIFSVFLLRGNLSSGEPVERWRWQRPRR